MQDVATAQDSWRPGKSRIQIGLTGDVALFLALTYQRLYEVYEAADDAAELLKLLAEANWESSETKWKEITFINRSVSFKMSETEQLRVVVSFSSNKQLTVSHHVWWKPGR
jgi:hypothetical protein